MRLNALRLINFRQHADTILRFDDGLTGIVGANGSGKSTILEAIAWALDGTPAARGGRDGIRWLKAPPRATVRVELDFDLGGHRYRVARGLTSAELFLDGAAAPIANSISGVSDLLRQRLRMTLSEFFNTYFTGQKELAVMAAMGPTARGQFLSRVLGYERLRAAQELIHDQRRLLEAEIGGLRQGMADPETVIRLVNDAADRLRVVQDRAADVERRRAAARRELDALTPLWESVQREREALQASIAELRVAEGHEVALSRDATRIERERHEIAEAREELERVRLTLIPLANVRSQLVEHERMARDEGRRQTLVETERLLVEELVRLRERHSQLAVAPELEVEVRAELELRRTELADADRALEVARTDWAKDQQEAETKIEQLKSELQEFRQQRERLVELGEDGTCPTCARPLHDHYRLVLDDLDERLEAVKVNGRYYRARIEQLVQMPPEVAALDERRRHLYDAAAKLDRRFAKVQAGIQELAAVAMETGMKERRHAEVRQEIGTLPIGYDVSLHDALRRELDRLLPAEARAQRLAALVERDVPLTVEWDRVSGQLVEARARVAALSERRTSLEQVESRFIELRAEYEGAAAAFRSEELAAVTAAGEMTVARAAVDAAEQTSRDQDRMRTQVDTLTRNRRVHEQLERAYVDMRTDLNRQLRPEIGDIAGRYLGELTDGRYTELELDESYNIVVLEDGIPKPVLSGGEQDLASLVLRLAISEMIADRAGQPFSLLILDEVFGSLDTTRRHNVIDLLRRLHDRFDQVIVLSHIDNIAEGLDHTIRVWYDEETGASRVDQDSRLELVLDTLTEGAA